MSVLPKTTQAVIGLAFGDEGKGAMVHHLVSQSPSLPLVIRSNGGPQAGHTVIHDGIRHVFHHFGSGSLQGAPTCLSHYFLCNPILFLKELDELRHKGVSPKVFVDPTCLVTTPYDMLLNEAIEWSRGDARHGSCGVGIQETIIRSEEHDPLYAHHALFVNDLNVFHKYSPPLREMVTDIRDIYGPQRLAELDITMPDHLREIWDSPQTLSHFVDDCVRFISNVTVVNDREITRNYDAVIYEGAQGRLLSQDVHAYYPYLTPSHTGIRNMLTLMTDAERHNLEVTYVTRAYTTRHGAGPLPHELLKAPYDGIVDATNGYNTWQESLRFSYLNLDLLSWALDMEQRDIARSSGVIPRFGSQPRAQLAITCLDQVDEEVGVIQDGKMRKVPREQLSQYVHQYLNVSVSHEGHGPSDMRLR